MWYAIFRSLDLRPLIIDGSILSSVTERDFEPIKSYSSDAIMVQFEKKDIMIDCPRVSPDLWRHHRQSCLYQEHFLSFVWSLWEHNWLNNYIKNKIGRKTVFFFLGKLFNRIYCWKIEQKYIWLRSIKTKTKYCSSK